MSFRIRAFALGAALALLPALTTHAAPKAPPHSARTLTLSQALSRAVAANPGLAAADREIAAAGGRRLQAGVFPNPELSFELDSAFGSKARRGLKAAETTLQISQLFELGGKRDARLAVAAAEIDAARWDRAATRLQVLAETTEAFAKALGAQSRVAELEDQVADLDRLTPLLQKRVEAGASSGAEIARGRVATETARVELAKARAAFQAARRELSVLIGDRTPSFAAVGGDLKRIGAPPSFDGLMARARRTPQLTRFTAVRAQRRALLAQAQAKAVPDITVGAGWRHYREDRSNAAMASLSVPLPLFDRNDGGVIEAGETLAKTEAERAAAERALTVMVGAAYEGLRGAYDEARLTRANVIPIAREAYAEVRSGYAEGRYSLLELLEARAALSDASLKEIDALVSFHASLASLEGLTGTALVLSRRDQ
ncbi:divalent cation transporter [Methylopila jiangsuensis]|uniref:Divalent cation transporter n=1 Tax=Methylopila jiangsuensis TaxID=586230 RepID=A0A9W6JHK5_9HYPH|nr:TolC family protein [Methylopila jiangsuensis]MDR6284833.1 cobalt-zinc-cadmium efflux system outer membrane protein [Methylopila jiangsuensis]GLK77776.1 divalent cation transporter [Methylopila jiangsuensis]